MPDALLPARLCAGCGHFHPADGRVPAGRHPRSRLAGAVPVGADPGRRAVTTETYTHEQAVADLQAVYDRLPSVLCKGRCWNSCTNVDATPLERALLAERGVDLPMPVPLARHEEMVAAGEHRWCPALGPLRTCTVYEARPLLCRSFGSWRSSACEYGCTADRWLSLADFAALMYEVVEISRRWERVGRPAPTGDGGSR